MLEIRWFLEQCRTIKFNLGVLQVLGRLLIAFVTIVMNLGLGFFLAE